MLTYIYYTLLLLAPDIQSRKLYTKNFSVLHKWTDLEFSFSREGILRSVNETGHYINKALLVDVDIEYGDDGIHRTFLTIPRLSAGVPYSLAVVDKDEQFTIFNPRIIAYPSYKWHSSLGLDCLGITSAIRTFIDECWRLWVVDSGQIASIQYCSPQIIAFDLVTDELVHRYTFPDNLYTPGISVFTALTVDVVKSDDPNFHCQNTTIYIADPWGSMGGLIVYNAFSRTSWRIEHILMHADENLIDSANDGIFTVSISPKNAAKGDRKLFFHTLSSYIEISIPLHIVNNSSIWTRNISSAETLGFQVVGNRSIQCESEVMDRGGYLYCSLVRSSAIISWQQSTEYNSDTLQVVGYNPDQFKFITGLKISTNSKEEEELWALSSETRLFVGKPVDKKVLKFQIIGCRIKNLLKNEHCTVDANHS